MDGHLVTDVQNCREVGHEFFEYDELSFFSYLLLEFLSVVFFFLIACDRTERDS